MKNSLDPKVIRKLKRNQLIRSFDSVVKEFPKAQSMGRSQSADHLLALEDEGKIIISFETVNSHLLCKINWLS